MLPLSKSKHNAAAKSIQQITKLLKSKIKNARSQYKNVQFHKQQVDIRQNQLNSKFLTRKKRLQSISKQNKNIYVKINTQKSVYGKQDLNRSYRSSSQISRRLSRLKMQSREDSFTRDNSYCSKRRYNGINLVKPSKPFVYQTIDVNKMNDVNTNNLKMLFFNEQNQEKNKKANDKQNKPIIKQRLPSIKSKNSILSERKYQIFNIKEVNEKHNIFKTIPVKKQSQLIRNQIKQLFFM